jgi:hypothetical protein
MACCLHAFYKDGDDITCYEMGITYLCYAKDAIGTKFQGKGKVTRMNEDKTCH